MTIRSRNRVNFVFLVFSALILLINCLFFAYHLFTNKITYSSLNLYDFWSVIANIFLINLYVVVISIIIIRTFEKTQATEVLFFLVFLLALLFDTSRLYVPVYALNRNYSETLIHLGNFTLAARLLAPISLFSLTAFSAEEYRQQTERNCLITILIAVFFAIIIPLNTSVIRENLCISYAFARAIRFFSHIICTISVITLFVHNNKNDFSQMNTLGFFMIIIGYNLLFYRHRIIGSIFGTAFLSTGTAFYLSTLHQHYLWTD